MDKEIFAGKAHMAAAKAFAFIGFARHYADLKQGHIFAILRRQTEEGRQDAAVYDATARDWAREAKAAALSAAQAVRAIREAKDATPAQLDAMLQHAKYAYRCAGRAEAAAA